jgi:hypothetical protein
MRTPLETKEALLSQITEMRNIVSFTKLKLTKSVKDIPDGEELWKAMFQLADIWDKKLQIEAELAETINWYNPIEGLMMLDHFRQTVSEMNFPTIPDIPEK